VSGIRINGEELKMKEIIVGAVNLRDFSNSKSSVLLEMIYEDLVTLLRFIHESQAEGLVNKPFYFTTQNLVIPPRTEIKN
jgi:hypothetical protein